MAEDAIKKGDGRSYNFGQALLAASQGQRKRDRTRAAIRNAGCVILDRSPLSSLTVSEICSVARVAHGTFYNYFPDQRAFVIDLLSNFVNFVQDVMKQAAKDDHDDPVRATMAAYYQLFENCPGMMKCLVNHQEDFPETKAAFHRLNDEWIKTVVASAELRLTQVGRDEFMSRDELYRRAYALGGMADQYLSALFLNKDAALAAVSKDRDAVIDTLTSIWKLGIYE